MKIRQQNLKAHRPSTMVYPNHDPRLLTMTVMQHLKSSVAKQARKMPVLELVEHPNLRLGSGGK
jgi:hypothetical protein